MKIVPKNFVIPEVFKTSNCILKPLTVNDLIKDYEAVMSSADLIRGCLSINKSWPNSNLTIEQDLIDLGWHQKEFQRKSSFAYVIWSKDGSKYLGCMYIFPSSKINYEVEVYFWIKAGLKGFEKYFEGKIMNWVKNDWPFKKVAYPGRKISWKVWDKLKDK